MDDRRQRLRVGQAARSGCMEWIRRVSWLVRDDEMDAIGLLTGYHGRVWWSGVSTSG